MTLILKGLYVTLSKIIPHHYAEHRVLFIIMLNIATLSVVVQLLFLANNGMLNRGFICYW